MNQVQLPKIIKNKNDHKIVHSEREKDNYAAYSGFKLILLRKMTDYNTKYKSKFGLQQI